MVFESSNETGQYWHPLKLEGTPCFHATPSCHVFTRGKSIDLDYKNKAWWVCRAQPLMPSVRRVVTFRARMGKYISGNRLSIDSYGHADGCSLTYSDVGCWMYSMFNCVRGSINRLCWRSTNNPKWVKNLLQSSAWIRPRW